MRRLLALAGVLGLLVLLAGPAGAAGTGGIEVTPYPGVVDGRQVTAFHTAVPSRGDVVVRYSLRNTTDAPVRGRLYAAAAARTAGGWTVGAAGSSPYVSLADQQVALAPRETRLATFTVHAGPDGRPSAGELGAVVVEVRRGAVVQRAATLVYLARGRTVPLPVLLVGAAVAVLAAAGGAVLVVGRRRPAEAPPEPAPALARV